MLAFSDSPLASDVCADANSSSVGIDESRYSVITAVAGELRDPEEELGAAFPSSFHLSYTKGVGSGVSSSLLVLSTAVSQGLWSAPASECVQP